MWRLQLSSCQLARCGYLSHLSWHFKRLIGTDCQLPDPDLSQRYSISSGFNLTNFPENVCCSSAPIDSSDHMLVKVVISLAVIREPPQRRRIWHFTQANWQVLQGAIKFQDWSPISTLTDINSSWEFFQRYFLSHTQIYPISSSVVLPFLLPMVH